MEAVITTYKSDKVATQIDSLNRKREKLAAACNAYEDFRMKVMEQIHNMPKEIHRIIFYQHYLQFKPLSMIAKEIHFDYSYVTLLNRKGLETFYKMNKEIIDKYVN